MTTPRRGGLAIGAVLASVALGLSGCGSATNQSTAAESPTTAAATETADPSAGLWDPCTGIPAAVLKEHGVDPSPPKIAQGLPIRGWKTCTWTGEDWYGLIVYSTHHTVDELKSSDSHAGVRPVTIGDRTGIIDHQSGLDYARECVVSLPAQQGMVEVSVMLSQATGGPERDLCGKAKDLTTAFLPYLPQ